MAVPVAVIEIGSTGIRLLVAEITTDNKRNILDRSELPLGFGHDVFTTGVISRDSLLQCIYILERFREQLKGWGIEPEQTDIFATSALREAKNKDPVLDRLYVKTGFKVRVIDGIEENRLMYIAVSEKLKDEKVSTRNEDSIIIEVGGGSTEIMLIKKGKMAGAHTLKLGTVRLEEQIRYFSGTYEEARRYVEDTVNNTKGALNNELCLSKVKQFIAVGAETYIAALNVGHAISPWLWEIDRENFNNFVKEIQHYSIEECVARFKISYNDAQQMHNSLLIYKIFLQLTNVTKIIIPETNIREGVIISRNTNLDKELQAEFYTQITASAVNLLKKYHGNIKHAEYVRSLSLEILATLKNETPTDPKTKLLLEVAAILHDIGMFIRLDHHNLHSYYIIKNSEIFGLDRNDIDIVAQITKFHRGAQLPQDSNKFLMLPRPDRMTILRLTSILRVADAIDRAHVQKLKNIKISFSKDSMIFKINGDHSIALERIALEEKADMFESIFGYKVNLI